MARDRYTLVMRKCLVKQFKPAGDLTSTQLELAQKLFEREAEVLANCAPKPHTLRKAGVMG